MELKEDSDLSLCVETGDGGVGDSWKKGCVYVLAFGSMVAMR